MEEARARLAVCVQEKRDVLDISGLAIDVNGAGEVAARLHEW